MNRLTVGVYLALSLTMSCSDGPSASAAAVPSGKIETADGIFESFEAELAIYAGTPGVQLSVGGSRVGEFWSLKMQLVAQDARSGSVTLPVGVGPVREGRAAVHRGRGINDSHSATEGAAEITLRRGHVVGRVFGAQPAGLDATFAGKLSLACWVPRSTLPEYARPGGGTSAPDGTEPLLLDERLVTEACASFRTLRADASF